ncbi:MAG: hypothetical protein JNN27_23295 [Planctomycetes bacterium]|nr:hypothetical protein [Planctomycetota bacterium]
MSEPHEFGGPVNRPAHNARQSSPGEALDGARTSGKGSDFLGLNEQLQPQPPPAQPAPAQQSWLLQHEEQPAYDLAPAPPAPSEDPSAMPPSAASLLNASWRETPNATRRPRWVAPVAGGALLATLGLIGLPLLRKPSPNAPEPTNAPRTRTRVVEPAAPKPVAPNASDAVAAAVEPVKADALLDRPEELASEGTRPARRAGDSRREAAPVNAPPPGASFAPPVEVFDPSGVWTVEGQGAEDEVDTSEGGDTEEHSGAIGADASTSHTEPKAEAREFVAVEAECPGEPLRRTPQLASAALDWDRLVWISQDLDSAEDESLAQAAPESEAADSSASSAAAGSVSSHFDDGVARALAAWLGSEGVGGAPQPSETPANPEPIVGVCDEQPERSDETGSEDTGVALALSDWGEPAAALPPQPNSSLESAAPLTSAPPAQVVEAPSPAPLDEAVEVRAARREHNAGELTFSGRRAALRDQLQRRRARQMNQAARQESAAAAELASVASMPTEHAPVEQAPVEQAPVAQAPVEQAPVAQAPVEQAPVEQAPVEQAPVEQAPVEQAPVAQAPVAQAPVEQAPVEQAPVAQAPVAQAPVAQAPVAQAPVEQAPVEQAPVEQAPVEQAPVEQAPVEQAPVAQAPVEQAPVEQAPVEQAPVEQAPVEQAPVEHAPVEQAPVEQAPVGSQSSGSSDPSSTSPAQPPVGADTAARETQVASGATTEPVEPKQADAAQSTNVPAPTGADELAEAPESARGKRGAARPRNGVPVVGPLPLNRRAGAASGRKPAAPQRVLQVATERDLEHVWPGTEPPLAEAQRPTRLATPNVGRARVVFHTGEIFEGDLVAVGEQRVWLRTKNGELGLDAARVGSVVRIAPGDTPTLGAAGSQKLAGLQRARVKTPGGMLTGRIIEQDAERTTLITDAGARIVLRSREVEVLGEKPAVQIRP